MGASDLLLVMLKSLWRTSYILDAAKEPLNQEGKLLCPIRRVHMSSVDVVRAGDWGLEVGD